MWHLAVDVLFARTILLQENTFYFKRTHSITREHILLQENTHLAVDVLFARTGPAHLRRQVH